MQRDSTIVDQAIIHFDKALSTLFGLPQTTQRDNPANKVELTEALTAKEADLSARLMRVNHSGEVSAQALYQGQALTAKLPDVRQAMNDAAIEENDHLVWCAQRLNQLSSHTSLLNPIWYAGSFALGAIAGKAGDKWSLGFVAETEKQVISHLEKHISKMSDKDVMSRVILEQMQVDERHHQNTAIDAGAARLPKPITHIMRLVSKIMTKSSYWI
ncbi:hypothetical protein LCGC14_2223010 [marine sediment metagenome]|uniref:Ubiquinone biosynthesis protein COQ7 n=2 Tax=root TaxID=1 RepID=A0A0F9DXX1_9ZZZZ